MTTQTIMARSKKAAPLIAVVGVVCGVLLAAQPARALTNPQSGATGLEGKVASPAPTVGATITTPRDGQTFTSPIITVAGTCPKGLLVKLFKNNVFAGSADCTNGSYSIQMDIFNGQNQLVARVYDALDQSGPDSNTVSVSLVSTIVAQASRVSLTSNYAKRGANPGEVLTWPIILSGGSGPYAISVDWGDGKAPDLKSLSFPGTFDITHTYANPGVYNIVVKATDKNGSVAFLQLVGVGNGPLSQTTGSGSSGSSGTNNSTSVVTKTKILWEPAAMIMPFVVLTFWLGKKHELKSIRTRIERGQRPF